MGAIYLESIQIFIIERILRDVIQITTNTKKESLNLPLATGF